MTRDAASGVCTGVTHRAQVLRCNPAHRRANAASAPAEVYGFRARHLRWRHGMAHMIGFIESLCSVQARLPLRLQTVHRDKNDTRGGKVRQRTI